MKFVPLKEIVTFKGGGTPSKKIPDYWSDGIPWATVKDFKELELTSTQDSISLKGLKNSSANLIPKGHVIIPTRMALGKAAINKIDLAINQDLKALIPKQKIHSEYLLYAILGLSSQIQKRGSGATVKGITLANLNTLKIPLPSIDNQIRIATLLNRVEALITARKDNLHLLDEFLKNTFLEMFGDPNKFDIKTIKELACKEKYSLSSGPFGSSLTSKHYTNDGVIVLRGKNISSGKLDLSDVKYISDKKALELVRSEIKPGNVVIVAVGSSGTAYLIPNNLPKAIMSQNFNKISPNEDIIPVYLEYAINSEFVQRQFRRVLTDGGRTFLALGKIKDIKINVPPINLQNCFASIIGKVEIIKNHYQFNLTELQNLYGALSQKAFNGELDVSKIPMHHKHEAHDSVTVQYERGHERGQVRF